MDSYKRPTAINSSAIKPTPMSIITGVPEVMTINLVPTINSKNIGKDSDAVMLVKHYYTLQCYATIKNVLMCNSASKGLN